MTTEISQVPLSGAQRVLDLARESGSISFLDVDVPPSVAAGEAELGEALLKSMHAPLPVTS